MTTVSRVFASTVATVLIGGSILAGQTPATGRAMREKLRVSQDVLEAVMTSNFELLSRSSNEMVETTKLPGWAFLVTPEYDEGTAAFLRAAGKLQDAARNRNSDGAFEAYQALNVSCYQCHRYIKGRRWVR